MKQQRIQQQLAFLKEIEAMKTILRRTVLVESLRRENDAEHSWHFAIMAMILYEYTDERKVDLNRVLRMALIHDLVEVYAGDTYAYDVKGYEDKQQRETDAAIRLFGMLPEDQGIELRALWREFEAMETPDALYANAIDRLQPLLNNIYTNGYSWIQGAATGEQVFARMEPLKTAIPEVWDVVQPMLEDCIKKGYLK